MQEGFQCGESFSFMQWKMFSGGGEKPSKEANTPTLSLYMRLGRENCAKSGKI